MYQPTTLQSRFLKLAEVLPMAYREHFVLMLHDQVTRKNYQQAQRALDALTKKLLLVRIKEGKNYVYGLPERFVFYTDKPMPLHPYHSLCVSKVLVELARDDRSGELISERALQALRWQCYPEVAIRYPSRNTALLLEFCTHDNVERGKVPEKVHKYQARLEYIQESLGQVAVLFVLDLAESEFRSLPLTYEGPFYFVRYETFRLHPSLTARIYFWSDGQLYPLRDGLGPD